MDLACHFFVHASLFKDHIPKPNANGKKMLKVVRCHLHALGGNGHCFMAIGWEVVDYQW